MVFSPQLHTNLLDVWARYRERTSHVSSLNDIYSSDDLPNVFFVDADHDDASDGHDGRDPARPLATIQQGIDNCTSGRGDIIFVAPGSYAENLTITSKDYITICGWLAPGYARPDVVPTTGSALVISLSQGTVLMHMRFASEDSDVVRNEGNGFHFEDCVFDGDSGMAATEALLRLWCDAADDSYTASEGVIRDCLFRGSPGYGIAFDVQNALVGVGPTHNVISDCRFIANTAEDIIALETAAGTYSIQDTLFERCYFMSRNKTTHVDLDTNNGASNSGNMFAGCYFHDDTIDTTAIKVATANAAVVGCYGLDGVIDGDALD